MDDRILQNVASVVEGRLDWMAHEISQRVHDEVAGFQGVDAPEVWELHRQVTRESRRVQLERARSGLTVPASCPSPDAEAARLAARAGIDVATALQAFRVGHRVALDVWLDAIDSLDVGESERREILKAVSRWATAYDDRIAVFVAEEYARELELAEGSPDKRRLLQVRDLIEGKTTSAESLDYDLALTHVSLVAWGAEPVRSLDRLASLLGRRLIWVPAAEQVLMAWLGGADPLDEGDWSRIAEFRPEQGSRIAVGNDAEGIDGFRQSHREAGDAHIVASRTQEPVTLYREVALEAFALRDEAAARAFVRHVLGPIDGADGRAGTLRETLRAYFAAGQNAASAAAALRVHGQTVPRRLQLVEELVGRPVNDSRAELELALRVEGLLQGSGWDA